ncbi:SURF1 family protein [Luteimicrobium sp. DT211]|uniref:SURF1 family protein n=1 Tax=Luteimicrobium sp. DT211 TaxID=3393412 RepID=UPI003CFA7263
MAGPLTWGQVARRPRMIGLLAVLLAFAALCGSLGAWQLDRAYARGDAAQQKQLDARLAAEEARGPEGLGNALAPQTTFTGKLVGDLVWVEGTYEPDGQVLVPDRASDGRTGYLVLTPLRVSDDGTSGASWAHLSGGAPVVPVVRGWVATPQEAPAAPSGTVKVDGYLQASEATTGDGHTLPAGQVDSVSSAQLANRWGGPIYSGYVVLKDSDPVPDPAVTVLPRPKVEGSGDVNLQSLSYAFQWWLFAVFAVFVWWRIVRDQRDHENAALAAVSEKPGADAGPDAGPGRGRSKPRVRRGEDGIAGLPAKR